MSGIWHMVGAQCYITCVYGPASRPGGLYVMCEPGCRRSEVSFEVDSTNTSM